jgi:hypothetical protein
MEKLTVGWTRIIDPYLRVTDFGTRNEKHIISTTAEQCSLSFELSDVFSTGRKPTCLAMLRRISAREVEMKILVK